MNQAGTSTLITVSEAARELEVSENTVRNLSDRGALPSTRTGGGIRLFKRSDVERLKRDRAKEDAQA